MFIISFLIIPHNKIKTEKICKLDDSAEKQQRSLNLLRLAFTIVVLASFAGGLNVLTQVLSYLPADFS